jgi:AAA15 family ATPase/GTPase
MFISKLQLKNFKRFTDLTIDLERPDEQPPKLVLLIGANGCGKSSIFDAFECINYSTRKREERTIPDARYANLGTKEYYLKEATDKNHFILRYQFEGNRTIFAQHSSGGRIFKVSDFNSPSQEECDLTGNDLKFGDRGQLSTNDFKFYGRSAYRYTPRIVKTTVGSTRVDISKDIDRPKTYIDFDSSRMDADIDQIFRDFFKEIKEKNNAQERFNTSLNNAFRNIFGDAETSIQYDDFDSPLDGEPVRFWFKKGSSRINYDLLSAGEKMIFELLLNLYARRSFFQDAIYFFDEIELHLNTAIQAALLKEIVENWIPEGSQVWVASHSLGFIDYARSSETAVIIDFDNLDFDQEKTLRPSPKSDLEIFEIAVPNEFLSRALDGVKLFLVEGEDAKYYGEMKLPKTLFSSMKTKRNKGDVFWQVINNSSLYGLIDSEELLDEEIQNIREKHPRLFFLKYYSIENYLFHPDNLFGENESSEKADYKKKLTEEKNKVRDDLIADLKGNRKSDPYFKWISSTKQEADNFQENYKQVINALKSDDFETFYKFLPMKDYSTELSERLNKDKIKLAQTQWFKEQMEKVLR